MDTYRSLANNTIRQMNMGVVGDIDAMIAAQEELMVVGIEGGVSYLQSNPQGGTPLQLTILNAEGMKSLTLDQIETLWHGGEFLKSKGIDPDKIDHFGPMMSLMDAVIHPATAYLLLKEYKISGNTDLLARVKAELLEVLEHVNHVEPSHNVQLSSSE
ncbi:MAG: hypothetical protein OEZ43_03345 [Gammaproteobacteria bacterium]|nr:hypothetical protein [Gammaproteobacteria bacterium]